MEKEHSKRSNNKMYLEAEKSDGNVQQKPVPITINLV